MGRKNQVPNRWRDYTALGNCILGTRIIPFKVPLSLKVCQNNLPEDEWFTPDMLLKQEPRIKAVIDLTNTHRYYNGKAAFESNGVQYVKIMLQGHGTLPTRSQIDQFFEAIDNHMKEDNDALVGVHCTHGLNRTGHLICRWMIDKLKIKPAEAIQRFNLARGHNMERQVLLQDLQTFSGRTTSVSRQSRYVSPLDDDLYEEDYPSRRYNWRSRDKGEPTTRCHRRQNVNRRF
ncbi:RNA/RNP complex-1-interacting phosphatase [Rhynchophorus ferrugineus]|uniref:RNA/RNP complex-1-interacting phosphatase n=1 Tax=Rhynchophorus ferrugineus TaxID=354439 RepID=UPI003FCEC13C